MDVATILTSIGSAIEVTKLIRASTTSLDQAEMKLKLAELVSALADTKLGISDIQQTIIDKDTEIRALKEQLSLREEMKFERPYYWREKNGIKEGPYCQQCYDNDSKQIRLTEQGNGTWWCRTCKHNFRDASYVKPPARAKHDWKVI